MIVDAKHHPVYIYGKSTHAINFGGGRFKIWNHKCSKGLAAGPNAHDIYRISCANNQIQQFTYDSNLGKMITMPGNWTVSDITTNAKGTLFAVDL